MWLRDILVRRKHNFVGRVNIDVGVTIEAVFLKYLLTLKLSTPLIPRPSYGTASSVYHSTQGRRVILQANTDITLTD
jgi:hypothetical protein